MCDSHRTHRPSSPSCCGFPSSASLVTRDFHRCRFTQTCSIPLISIPSPMYTHLQYTAPIGASTLQVPLSQHYVRCSSVPKSSSRVLNLSWLTSTAPKPVCGERPCTDRFTYTRPLVGTRRCCRSGCSRWKRGIGVGRCALAHSSDLDGTGSKSRQRRRDTKHTRDTRQTPRRRCLCSRKMCYKGEPNTREKREKERERSLYILR